MIEVLKCSIIPHDFLFFVSREFNTKTTTTSYIHNYALMYSLRNKFAVASSSYVPTYKEDLYELDYYCNPAFPNKSPSFTFQTYNSIDLLRNSPEEPKNRVKNVPSFGRYQKIIPLSTEFTFYTLVKRESNYRFPRIIRLGKKLSPCKLSFKKLKIESINLTPNFFEMMK